MGALGDLLVNNPISKGIKFMVGGIWYSIVWLFTPVTEINHNAQVGKAFKDEFNQKIN